MVYLAAIDGKPEVEFRSEIENLLRVGRPNEALSRLRGLLAPLCNLIRILPERFLTISPVDIELVGWDRLAANIAALSKPGQPITALGIDFSWPGHFNRRPDSEGSLEPAIETNYYSDSAWPFSTANREELLAGCADYACEWAGCFDDIDDTLSATGMGDLYGAVFLLGERTRSEFSSDEEIQGYVLGACLLATILHLAVRDHAVRNPLPRPLALIVGSNEDYPHFNVPVFASTESPWCPCPEMPMPTTPDVQGVQSVSAPSLELIELQRRMARLTAKMNEARQSGKPLSKAEKGRLIGEGLIISLQMIEVKTDV